jgi:hypothetical protein
MAVCKWFSDRGNGSGGGVGRGIIFNDSKNGDGSVEMALVALPQDHWQ